MVPEFRKMFGFESQGQKPVTTINGSEQIKNSAPSTPPRYCPAEWNTAFVRFLSFEFRSPIITPETKALYDEGP